MGDANLYPPLTVTADTRLLGVEDPSDPGWAVKLYDPADISGGGGGSTWDLVVDSDGTSGTGWSSTGTNAISSDGTVFGCASAASAGIFKNTAHLITSQCVLKTEIKFTSFGGAVAQAGIGIGEDANPVTVSIVTSVGDGTDAQARVNRFFVGGGGLVSLPGGTISTGVWYTLAVLRTGTAWTIFFAGSLLTTIECPNVDKIMSSLVLTSYNAATSWRNVKAWNLAGLPS